MTVRSAPGRDARAAPLLRTPPLVLAGAPLSGAGIVAQALARAGLPFGDRLLPPPSRDPAGAYVDADIARLHDALLGTPGTPADSLQGLARRAAPPDFAERAAPLVAARTVGPQPWVWRDPRAALLLPEWDRVLPAARWILTVRDPADVVWSAIRRQGAGRRRGGFAAAARGVRIWTSWHRRILDFARRHPDRCVVVAVPEDLTAEGGLRLEEILRGWGYPVGAVDLAAAFNPHLLKTRRPRLVTAAVRLDPTARRLADELVEQGVAPRRGRRAPSRPPSNDAGLPALLRSRPDANGLPERSTVALVVRERFGSSETFIGTHARRLPARVLLLHGRIDSLRTRDDLPMGSLPERLLLAIAGRLGADRRAAANRTFARWARRNGVGAALAEYGTVGAEIQDACRAAGVPLVVHFHGFDAYRDDVLRSHRDRYRRLFAGAAALVAVSSDMVEQLVSLGAPRERVACVPCGVDVSLFGPGDPAAAPPAFVSVGRFVDKKAPHCTLLAFAEVAASFPGARLVMVGDGPLLESCRRLARTLGLGDAAVFTGPLPNGEIPAVLRGARAYVQHSIRPPSGDSEGTPVSVLEAGACGLPVVATRHGGIPDVVVHGETGFLVDEGDVAGMADHMLRLARRPALAAALGRAGRARVCALHSEDRAIAALWDVVRRATAPSGDATR